MVKILFLTSLLLALSANLPAGAKCSEEAARTVAPADTYDPIKGRVLEMASWLTDRGGDTIIRSYKHTLDALLKTFNRTFFRQVEIAAIILAVRMVREPNIEKAELNEARLTLEAAGFTSGQARSIVDSWLND